MRRDALAQLMPCHDREGGCGVGTKHDLKIGRIQ